MEMANEDMAVLLQDAISELQASRRQTEALVRQNEQLMDQNTQLTQRVQQMIDGHSRGVRNRRRPKIEVSVHTKNLIHRVYHSINGRAENKWNFEERFDAPCNKELTRNIIREVQNDVPSVKEDEILVGCRVYFKSLSEDNKRRQSGLYDLHRAKQKRTSRLKHKLQIRKMGIDAAASANYWSAMHQERVRELLTTDFMSSESSADESDGDNDVITKSALKVKKIVWLRKKYRAAFHQIDKAYYATHKNSRDKLKQHIPGGNSKRLQPSTAPKFAVKSEYRSTPDHEESGIFSGDDLNESSNSLPSLQFSESPADPDNVSELSPNTPGVE